MSELMSELMSKPLVGLKVVLQKQMPPMLLITVLALESVVSPAGGSESATLPKCAGGSRASLHGMSYGGLDTTCTIDGGKEIASDHLSQAADPKPIE